MKSIDFLWGLDARFSYDFRPQAAGEGDLLVGVGIADAAGQAGLVLDPKASGERSVTAMVIAATSETVDAWRRKLPAGAASIRNVIMEDLSLDSCFGLVLFASILQEGPLDAGDEGARAWCDYVNRWEAGYTHERRPVSESIAVLLTVLGHSYFNRDQADSGAGLDARLFEDGARACLELLTDALAQERPPGALDLTRLENRPSYQRALRHLAHEREQYRLALGRGRHCQLSLPLQATGKRLLVDALFLEERSPSGIVKLFARNDHEHTWTQRGFELLGIYRPLEAGSGGDMTISTSPESRLTLGELWEELERLENERWQGRRPADAPREIRSYSNGAAAPNEPWWDDHGNYTLLAAPRLVEVDGKTEPGSKLDWVRDVLPAVWRTYSPIPETMLTWRPLGANGAQPAGMKKLTQCGWTEPLCGGDCLPPSPVVQTPTFSAWLAALSSTGAPASPLDLPSPGSYRVFLMDGGCVVVHRDGATAFNDWTSRPLNMEDIEPIFMQMSEAAIELAAFHETQDLVLTVTTLEARAEKLSSSHASFEEWKTASLRARNKALVISLRTLNHADPWPLGEFRRLLGEVWGLTSERDDILLATERVDQLASEYVEAARGRGARLMQALVSGLALGIVAKEVAETLRNVSVDNPYEWQLSLWRDLAPQKDIAALHAMAELVWYWEWGALAALCAGVAVGVGVYLKFGTRSHSE